MLLRRPLVVLLPLLLLVLAACSQIGSSPSPTGPAGGLPGSPGPASPATSPGDASPATSPGGSPATSEVEVVGVEYRFENVPAQAAVGTTLRFRNAGSEVHEMVVVRKNDDVTESWEELLTLPDDEALRKVTLLGAAVAPPGEPAAETVTVDQPGDYLMICFIPVGTTSMSIDPSAPPTGAPHFTQGMLAEFSVGG